MNKKLSFLLLISSFSIGFSSCDGKPKHKLTFVNQIFGDLVKTNAKDGMFEEGYEFDLGGMKVATLMVPGHTSGSMVFFLEGQDLLFSGDAIGSGHGVWIFSLEAFKEYVDGVDHLVKYIENEDNGINKDALKMYGGHYWQKDWYPELNGGEFGMTYIYDMQKLIDQIAAGNARMEPSGIDRPVLDTYFKNGQATIAWNAQLAEDWRNSLGE